MMIGEGVGVLDTEVEVEEVEVGKAVGSVAVAVGEEDREGLEGVGCEEVLGAPLSAELLVVEGLGEYVGGMVGGPVGGGEREEEGDGEALR